MKRLTVRSGSIILVFIGLTVLLIFTVYRFMPSNPLEDSEQLVLVLAGTQNSRKAVLQLFTHEGESWRFSFSCPVVIGKNGMAWGRGLHREKDREEGEPVKHEGDGTSPEGVFPLIHAYGYPPPSMVRIKFPYTQATPDLICCDDPETSYYTKIINIRDKDLNPNALPSHEKMLRADDLYKYTILIGHNTWYPRKDAGSCIFIHIWSGMHSYTAGCTAMSEENILRLLSELDPDKNPIFVMLSRKNYLRLKHVWGLPDVTI